MTKNTEHKEAPSHKENPKTRFGEGGMAAPGSVLVEGGSECFSVLCVPLNITTESSRIACELEEETLCPLHLCTPSSLVLHEVS